MLLRVNHFHYTTLYLVALHSTCHWSEPSTEKPSTGSPIKDTSNQLEYLLKGLVTKQVTENGTMLIKEKLRRQCNELRELGTMSILIYNE